MPHRIGGVLLQAFALAALLPAAVAALLLADPPTAAAQAEEPALPVFHRSLSPGLSADTEHCAAALRALTRGILVKSTLTHVTGMGPDRRAVELERLPAVPPGLLAYTLQGPGDEVAILVCGPAAIQK